MLPGRSPRRSALFRIPPLGTGDAVRAAPERSEAGLAPQGEIDEALVLFADTPLLRTETLSRLLAERAKGVGRHPRLRHAAGRSRRLRPVRARPRRRARAHRRGRRRHPGRTRKSGSSTAASWRSTRVMPSISSMRSTATTPKVNSTSPTSSASPGERRSAAARSNSRPRS